MASACFRRRGRHRRSILRTILLPNPPYYPPYNPTIIKTPTKLDGAYIDPVTGQVIVNTSSTKVKASALNPLRDVEIPGSKYWVDRWETDAYGRSVHVTGWQWRSVTGQLHGTLNRQTVSAGPGGTIINNNVTEYRSAGPRTGTTSAKTGFKTGTTSTTTGRRTVPGTGSSSISSGGSFRPGATTVVPPRYAPGKR